MNEDKSEIPTNQESTKGQEELLGGSTNLSLDQLKAEGKTTTTSTEEDADDLREIRTGDDLDEPDAEEAFPQTTEGDQVSTEKGEQDV